LTTSPDAGNAGLTASHETLAIWTMIDLELRHQKRIARKQMKSTIAVTTAEQRLLWSKQIAGHVTDLSEWNACQIILAFLPTDYEVNIMGMIENALSAGKTVAVPRMHRHHIEFHKIESTQHSWEHHPFGIREPPKSLPIVDPCAEDADNLFVITPGLCFDLNGRRLGFGKGYYDRLLEQCRLKTDRWAFFTGVCYSIQLMREVPIGPHDKIVDSIVTETGVVFHRPIC